MQTCESLKRQLAEARQLANLPPVKAEETGSSSLYQIKPNDSDDEGPGEQAAHPGQAQRDSPDPSGVSTGDITGSQRECMYP